MAVPKALNIIFDALLSFLLAFYFTLEKLVLSAVPLSWRAKDVSGQVALVTGGGAGLGRLFALRLAELGCRVVVWDLDTKGNEETAKLVTESGGDAKAYTCDVSKREDVYRVADKVKRDVGPVAILVNNAGVVTGRPLLESSDESIERTFAVNTMAHFWTCKAFLPGMISSGQGHIVNVASLAGFFGCSNLVDYCATKFAVVGFGESLHQELRGSGQRDIKITTVCPYFINTGMFEGVRSKILPILKPEFVVKKAVEGMLVNEELVVVPSIMNISIFLKGLFTVKGFDALSRSSGAHNFMDQFVGHGGKKV